MKDQTEKLHTIAAVATLLSVTEDDVLQAGALGNLTMGIYWPETLFVKANRYDADRMEFIDEGMIPPTGFIPVHPEIVGWIWRTGEGQVRLANGRMKKGDEWVEVSYDLQTAMLIHSAKAEDAADGIIISKNDLLIGDDDLAKWQPAKGIIERQQARIAELEELQAKGGNNLPDNERKKMLKIILGMAMGAYGYDPESKRNEATGKGSQSILAGLQQYGLGTDPDAIKDYLDEAASIHYEKANDPRKRGRT